MTCTIDNRDILWTKLLFWSYFWAESPLILYPSKPDLFVLQDKGQTIIYKAPMFIPIEMHYTETLSHSLVPNSDELYKMYLNLRCFPFPKQSNSTTPTEPRSEPFSFSFSSLRSRFLIYIQKQKKQKQQQKQQQKQPPKAVHWGSITIIQDTEDESKPYNHTDIIQAKPSNQKPILKPATPLDITTSYASLWELIHETESRIGLNYECLAITGDAPLDAWLRKEEEAMFRRANVVARASLNNQVGMSKTASKQNNDEEWEFVADVGAGIETGSGSENGRRIGKPRRARRRRLRVSALRVPVLRVNTGK